MRIYSLILVILTCLSSWPQDSGAGSESANATMRPATQLYRRYCVSCHGNDGKAKTSRGKFNHARDLTDAQWQSDVSDERIFNSIMNGRNVRGNMPSFSDKLKEDEVNSLVNLVRGLKGSPQP